MSPPIPDLSNRAGRHELLRVISTLGADAVRSSADLIWSQLAPPRAERCTNMAIQCGLHAVGREALAQVLNRFIDDFDAIVPGDLPDESKYSSRDEWNAACSAFFGAADLAHSAVIAKYDAILSGRSPSH